MKVRFLIPLILASLSMSAFAEEAKKEAPKAPPAKEEVAQPKNKKVPTQLVQGMVNYLAGRKLGDALDVFMKIKQTADAELKKMPDAQEILLPADTLEQVMGLMRQEPMFQLYLGLQSAPFEQAKKESKEKK